MFEGQQGKQDSDHDRKEVRKALAVGLTVSMRLDVLLPYSFAAHLHPIC